MSTRLSTRETFIVWDDETSTVYELWLGVGDDWIMRVVPYDRAGERSVHGVNEFDPFSPRGCLTREDYARIYNETVRDVSVWSITAIERQLAELHVRLYALKNELRARDRRSNGGAMKKS